MSDDQIKREREFQALISHKNISQRNMFYSSQRIDLIVISLSTGLTIPIFALLKTACCHNKYLLISSLVLCLVSIITNISSQFISHKANKIESNWASKEMEVMNQELTNEDIKENTVGSSDSLSKYISILNYSSIAIWIIAVTLIIISL